MHTQPLPRGAQAFCNQVSTSTIQRYSRNIRNTCGHPKSISSHGTILIFAHSPGTIFSAAWSRESQTRPLNCPSIASSYHSFPTQRGRFQTTCFNNTYSYYMFLDLQVTSWRGDYRPLPPSLVTRSTKLNSKRRAANEPESWRTILENWLQQWKGIGTLGSSAVIDKSANH